MKSTKRILITLLALAAAMALWSQTDSSERIVVPFSDPGKPGLVKANLINGGIVVKGYEGKEVIIEAKPRAHVVGDDEEAAEDEDLDNKNEDKHAGMKRLKAGGGGLEVEESKNIIDISVPSWKMDVDLFVQVPLNTALELGAVNNGGISVENISGDIEVANVNGKITLSRISGTVVAQTVNGDVTATFARFDGKKPLSLITLNGDVDITLPASAKASFKLKIDNHGEIYSDFELALQNKTERTVEDKRGHGGHYRVTIDKTVSGSINGGGQEITLNTFNGDILLRKAK